jgi:hypothetical protein
MRPRSPESDRPPDPKVGPEKIGSTRCELACHTVCNWPILALSGEKRRCPPARRDVHNGCSALIRILQGARRKPWLICINAIQPIIIENHLIILVHLKSRNPGLFLGVYRMVRK